MNDKTIAADAPPDWEARSSELLCPLCKYNLRGLSVPRCPECGFAFSWNELIEAEKNKHKYLFEHARGIGFKSFWKTYWRTSWPRRFWTDLNPAQPVRVVRMIVYWIIATAMVGAVLSTGRVMDLVDLARYDMSMRATIVPVAATPGLFTSTSPRWPGMTFTASEVKNQFPLPWEWEFWSGALEPRWYSMGRSTISLEWFIVFLSWPWLTLVTLIVFRISMRQAKIRRVHLVRSVLYSCDFGILLWLSLGAITLADVRLSEGWIVACSAPVCAVVTTYRLTIAFRQYLRVHLPFATVLASQLIALLVVFLLLVQIADFGRRV
jgi:hypothetical protein